MEENKTNESNINTDEIKKEAAETVNQVKDTIKNTNLKKDANEAKGFFMNFIKNPIGESENVARSTKNQFLKISIIILVIWLVVTFVNAIIGVLQSYSYMTSYYSSFGNFFKNSVSNIFSIIKAILGPVACIAVLTLSIYALQKGEKKSFLTIASSVLVAKIPVVVTSVLSLLTVFSSQVYKITRPVSSFLNIISTILLYFTIKALYNEKEDTTFIKKFAIIMAIFYAAYFVLSFLGIYI